MSGVSKIRLVETDLPTRDELEPLLDEIWRRRIVTTGPVTRRFEEAVESELGVEHAVMVNHGMTALLLAVRALGLEGEVVIPSFSWTATAGALVWNGIEPVFADITPGRMTLDPAAAEAAITPRTRAIMPVNVFGVPPEMEAFEELGRRHGLVILHDSAQGLGSRYAGRRSGGFGRAECFSMSPTKVVSALEGGLVTTDDADLAARVRSLRVSGKDPDTGDIVGIGLSGRPSEVHAAVALKNLERMDELIDQRVERCGWYRELLDGLPGVTFQEIPPDVTTTGNYFYLRVGADAPVTRETVIERLEAEGIESKRYFFPAIHRQRAYAHLTDRYDGRLPVTEDASANGLALPLYGTMTRAEVERVALSVRNAF